MLAVAKCRRMAVLRSEFQPDFAVGLFLVGCSHASWGGSDEFRILPGWGGSERYFPWLTSSAPPRKGMEHSTERAPNPASSTQESGMSDRFRGPATERPFCRSVLGPQWTVLFDFRI